jgi:hypothetical protein
VFDGRRNTENSPQCLGYLLGNEVWVNHARDGQQILIPEGDTGQRLACLIGFGKAHKISKGDKCYWLVSHSRQVDHLLVELIDLLVSIRYAHPTMVQLEMILEPDGP